MSSRSRNRSETSREPASTPARSPSSLSKSRDSQAASDSDDDDTHRSRQHSRIDVDELREAPSAPTSSTQRKADNDDVSAPAALPFSLSLTLQNTGSVARDHLASERTFLAYVRTSLSFASAGVGTSSLALPASIFSYSAFFFSSKFLLVHVALVQLFRVSVSTSANSSSGGGMAVGSYARPLGATLIAFGIAVLVTGEFVTPFPFPLPLPFSLFLDTIHIAAQANALTGRSPSQVLFDISPSSARCHRDCSLLHV